MAAELYVLGETQTSLTKYAQHFLIHKAKSHSNILPIRIQQLTTLLDKGWYSGSSGIYVKYRVLQQTLYTFLENMRNHLQALMTFAMPAHRDALMMESKLLKGTFKSDAMMNQKRIVATVGGQVKRLRNPFSGEPLPLNNSNMSQTPQSPPPSKRIKTEGQSSHYTQPAIKEETKSSTSADTVPCNHCGGSHKASTTQCPFVKYNHEHVNMEANTPWTQSKFYKLYEQHPWYTKHGPQKRLRHNFILEHNKDTDTYHYKEGVGMPSAQRTQRGTFISNMSFSTFLATMFRVKPINSPLLTFSILPNISKRSGEEYEIPRKRKRKKERKKIINQDDSQGKQANACLIDTGAVDSSYISLDLAKSIQELGYEILNTNQDPSVSTAFAQGAKFPSYGKITFYVKIYNEVSNTYESICIHNARIIDSPIDIIIGQPTIYLYNLLEKCKD